MSADSALIPNAMHRAWRQRTGTGSVVIAMTEEDWKETVREIEAQRAAFSDAKGHALLFHGCEYPECEA